MNEHDLLDAIGGIDPKFIKSADRTVLKHKKIAKIQSYYFAAAGLLLLVVAGIVIRNNHIDTTYESINETEEITTLGAIPEETEGEIPDAAEGSPMLTSGVPEGSAETDGIGNSEESEAIATEESLATESSDSDYPAMVMYDGAVYKDSGEDYIGEVLDDNLLQVSSYTDGEPSENGQQNFDRSSETKFFVLNEEAIVVLADPNEGIWRIFKKQ
ncbi:MAG: hypothetical protein J6O61_09590 [Butyrivibrio sp.]|uniref:hypothetical protein n=1 Tax=Butyrivibrio sp. TaxID=28121 RepID=UPI001B2B33BF|nr:hypothetical protein [Butyrivibrio sp.]MBO6241061.1 hypothetical protein [Butyrivibrio sp.]